MIKITFRGPFSVGTVFRYGRIRYRIKEITDNNRLLILEVQDDITLTWVQSLTYDVRSYLKGIKEGAFKIEKS